MDQQTLQPKTAFWKRVWNSVRIFFIQLSNEPIAYLAKVFKGLMLLALTFSFIFFIYVVAVACYDVLGTHGDEMKEQMIVSLEALFLAPLPFVIIGAFYYYFRVHILPELNTEAYAKNRKSIIVYSSYFLGVTKLLFISTLISLLATRLLETIDFHDKEALAHISYKSFLSFFALIVFLLIFYFILEKHVHGTIKNIMEMDKDKKDKDLT